MKIKSDGKYCGSLIIVSLFKLLILLSFVLNVWLMNQEKQLLRVLSLWVLTVVLNFDLLWVLYIDVDISREILE